MKHPLALAAGMLLADPAAAIVISRADLDCVPSAGGEACFTSLPLFAPQPVPGRSRVTLATDGVRFGASASFQAIYRWATFDPDGFQTGGNNSIGATGSFAYDPAAPGAARVADFVLALAPGPFSLAFTSDVPRNTDRCPVFLADAPPGSACTETFQRVFIDQSELVFHDPPERFTLTVTASAVPEPGTWVLLVLGFGLVGMAARQRSADARPRPGNRAPGSSPLDTSMTPRNCATPLTEEMLFSRATGVSAPWEAAK